HVRGRNVYLCASGAARAYDTTVVSKLAQKTSHGRPGSPLVGNRDVAFEDHLVLLGAKDHQSMELNPAAPSMREGGASAVDLMLAGASHDLHRGFGLPHHRRSANRVGRKHAARRVDRQVAGHLRGSGFDELAAFAALAEIERLRPQHLLKRERLVK